MRTTTLLLSLFAAGCITGCKSWENPPVETLAQQMITEVIAPAVQTGLQNGVANLDLQGGIQGINPTYVATFEGLWVTGVQGKVSVGIDGVAGQITGASSGGPLKAETPVLIPTTEPAP